VVSVLTGVENLRFCPSASPLISTAGWQWRRLYRALRYWSTHFFFHLFHIFLWDLQWAKRWTCSPEVLITKWNKDSLPVETMFTYPFLGPLWTLRCSSVLIKGNIACFSKITRQQWKLNESSSPQLARLALEWRIRYNFQFIKGLIQADKSRKLIFRLPFISFLYQSINKYLLSIIMSSASKWKQLA
jgi:hypothetical protein